jgi:diacylglycerol kinase family enzyme
MHAEIGVITNPNSKKNRKHTRRLRQLERAAGRRAIVRETASVAELPGAVDELLDAGCRYWVSDGGDGALHWLLTEGHRAIRRRQEAGLATEWPAFVPTNGGTIDFVAKKAGIRGHAEDILVRLGARLDAGRPPEDVLLGTVWATGEPVGDAPPLDRLGFACAIGGVAQRFFAKYYEDDIPGPHTIVKVLTAGFGGHLANTVGGPVERLVPAWVREYAADLFRPLRATVEVDGAVLPFHELTTVQAGSIDINLGNVVRTFRHAAGGGALHLQALSMTPAEAFLNLPTMVMGTKVKARNTYDGPAQRIRVTAEGGDVIDPVVDGERFFAQRVLELRLGPPVRIPRV